MKTAVEVNHGLQYKLCMMGIPIEEPTYICGDNMSVLYNTSKPESTLKKKFNSIGYHFVHDSVAMGESLTGFIRTDNNVADLITKPLPHGEHWVGLIQKIMWDIYSMRLKQM